MPAIISERETYILIADENSLFPANFVIPADDLFPLDPEIRQVANIVAGSLKLNELIAESVPQLGQIFSTKFECKVYLEDNLSGKYINVYQQNNGVYSTIFAGKIDSCKLDKVGTDRTLVAYDLAYDRGKQNIADWWNTFWATREQATLREARDSMLDSMGIPHEEVSLPNDTLIITKNVDFTSCTLTAMLKMMCEISYCFPHMNRDGFMEFLILNTDPDPIDITGKYEWLNSTFEEYETEEIGGVQFYDSGNQLKWTCGDYENAYPVKKNVLLYDLDTETLDDIGQSMLEYLQDLKYTPANVKMIVGDFDLKLGDYVHTEKGDFYILQNTYSGSQFIEQKLVAKGSQYLYSGTSHLDYGEIVLNERIARVSYNLEQFYVEYGSFKNETNAKFTITDTAISSKVSKGDVSSEISQEAGAISISANRLTISSTNFTLAADGSITATNASLSGTLTAGSDTLGTKKKIIIDDGVITGYNEGVEQAHLEIGNGLFNIVGKLALNGVVGVSGSTSFVKDVTFENTSLGNVLTGFQTTSVITGLGSLTLMGSASATGSISVSGIIDGSYVTLTGSANLPVSLTGLNVIGSPTTVQVPHTVTQNTLQYVKAVKGAMGAIQSADGLIQSIS